MTYHLAQVNVARMRAPIDSDVMRGFVERLEVVNATADASPGFVWRLQTADGDATALRVFDDSMVLVNLSVWESLAALHGYVYQGRHAEAMRHRREWFEQVGSVYVALWWVMAGHHPSIHEAKERLQHLQQHSPSAYAFTFREPFQAPAVADRLPEFPTWATCST